MSNSGKKEKTHRYITRDGGVNIDRKGLHYHHPRDWYHWMLTLSWAQIVLFIGVLFFIINLFFGGLYWLDASCIEGADPSSFWDYFFFSVQTFGTIGYGHMWPKGNWANSIMAVQSFLNFCSFGLITGLLFSRFSRPSARVMFSNFAVISPYEGRATLSFRAANRRGNQILQAQVHVSLSRNETTMEGESIRRIYDLKVLRPTSSFFNLTWTIRHVIDADSPLYEKTPEDLRDSETEIIVLLSGIDDVYGQLVHGRFAFNHEEILFGYRFVNMFDRKDHGGSVVDYTKFNSVERLDDQV